MPMNDSTNYIDNFVRGGVILPLHDTELREDILNEDGKVSQDALSIDIVSAGIDATNHTLTLDGDSLVGLEGKVDKVLDATSGNFAGLDSNGNLTDSGIAPATIEAIVNVYGSKNLLHNTATTIQLEGVTITINTDGSVTLTGKLNDGVTYTGLDINHHTPISSSEYYILSGASSTNYKVAIQCYATDWTVVKENRGIDTVRFNGNDFSGKDVNTRIIVYDGADFTTPVTLYPMIRDARISDSTYVPYAMTNMELTEKKADKGVVEAISGEYSQWVGGTSYTVGDIVIYNNVLYYCIANNSSSMSPDQRVGQYWKVTSIKELTNKKADKTVPAASGNLATLDSSGNLTDGGIHPNYLIKRTVDYINMQGGGNTTITFYGNAENRIPHFMLLLCGQSGCCSPIIVGFSGQYGRSSIQGVFVSNTFDGWIQISGTSITIPDGFGGWGTGLIFNLLPNDNVEYTITRE